jgi:hypothetical protein
MEAIYAVVGFGIVAVCMIAIVTIVKESFKHRERMEKIRHGYPVDGTTPGKGTKQNEELADIVDYRGQRAN